ncbi:MAG: hypothetical protein OXH09_14500 [Gammaproteobacteria bacterium]|nr:hypothetical protein [Gammaproteobacteria bacterium]
MDIDNASGDSDSYTLFGSYEISGFLHLWGWIDRTAFDDLREVPIRFTGLDIPAGFPSTIKSMFEYRLATASGGVGVHRDLTAGLSGYARLGVAHTESEIEAKLNAASFAGLFAPDLPAVEGPLVENTRDTLEETDTDLVVSAGLRYAAVERVELFGGVSQTGGDTAAHAGVELRLGGGWGVQFAGAAAEDAQGVSVCVVWRF